MDAEAPILLSVDQTVALLLAEAEAERAVADPTAPDPCAWVGSSRGWVDDLIKRPLNPLPVHVRGTGHFVDVADANQAAVASEAFARTIQSVADFSKVAETFLLSPGMIILRAYSLRTRSAQDRSVQQNITMTG